MLSDVSGSSKRKMDGCQKEDVLDAPYFHMVFTVPDILNPVIYSNQKLLYDVLYHAASATINDLTADPKYLGASTGYICILHTWGSEMNFHPHIHTILLGGGLSNENRWKTMAQNSFCSLCCFKSFSWKISGRVEIALGKRQAEFLWNLWKISKSLCI